ncbi:hypothetical protein FQZ97_1249530 [compost metagenome]
MHDVVLDIQAALGLAHQFDAGAEGVEAGGQQAEAGLLRMRLGALLHRGAKVGAVRRQSVCDRWRRAGAAAEEEQRQQQEAWEQGGSPARSAGGGSPKSSGLCG